MILLILLSCAAVYRGYRIQKRIQKNDTRLRVAITQLAELFRSSLQATDEHLITLRKELVLG